MKKKKNIIILFIFILISIMIKTFIVDYYNLVPGRKIKKDISLFFYVFIDRENPVDYEKITPKIRFLNLFKKDRYYYYKNNNYCVNFWIDSKTGEVTRFSLDEQSYSKISINDIILEIFDNEKFKERVEKQYLEPPEIFEDESIFRYEFTRKKNKIVIFDNMYKYYNREDPQKLIIECTKSKNFQNVSFPPTIVFPKKKNLKNKEYYIKKIKRNLFYYLERNEIKHSEKFELSEENLITTYGEDDLFYVYKPLRIHYLNLIRYKNKHIQKRQKVILALEIKTLIKSKKSGKLYENYEYIFNTKNNKIIWNGFFKGGYLIQSPVDYLE
ncbi:hypothetical protein KAU33_07785 [Candidatus Dependentiae bacterium]|nr:hypothetical protein [Candidatus Dependentiae bacterium]